MLELEHGFRIVDVHTRIEPDEQRRARPGLGDPEQLEREMHQAGVVRAVAYPGSREGSYLKANNAVARMSVGRPLVAFARINGARDAGSGAGSKLRNLRSQRGDDHASPDDVEQYAYDDRFFGFKLHPPKDGLPDEEVLSRLADVGLPVLVHGGESFAPEAVARELLGYEFPVVLAHFGAHPLRADLMNEAIDLLGSHDGLYLDTSVVRYREPLERAIMEHPDRVLFGSGAPHAHPNVAVMEILTLDVPEDAMKKVFSNNPVRVVEGLAP
ncbi:amidohydrolase family protein [Halomicroarcula limicola]|uniref:Amidohydrolase family protein n=1 Tax=Haloarcula limicola TaxID=1429915 RepID=A0A8J7Y8I9_9EURY|nr:amidohydrolase family protein [Halomicroarcula limicola]MBV0923718.1 amidohydrolase family protein [Halomicroarcula limicola]